MSRYGLGLKLGVTSVTAAVARGAEVHVVSPLGGDTVAAPAVVYAGAGRLVTGAPAERLAIGRGERLVGRFLDQIPDASWFHIGDESYPAAALLAAVVGDVITGVTDGQGQPPDGVCLTHPTHWPSDAADALEAAVRSVTGERGRLQLVPAAVASGVDHAVTESLADGTAILVCDMGATGFEVALVGRRGSQVLLLGTPPERQTVGGETFDAAVLELVDRATRGAVSGLDPGTHQSAIALQRLRRDCRRAKEELSRTTAADLCLHLPAGEVQLRLTRAELDAALAPQVERFASAITRALRAAAPAELAAIVLTGGSTQIPLVRALADAIEDRPPVVTARYAAAHGAAFLAAPPPSAATPGTPRGPRPGPARRLPVRPSAPPPATGPASTTLTAAVEPGRDTDPPAGGPRRDPPDRPPSGDDGPPVPPAQVPFPAGSPADDATGPVLRPTVSAGPGAPPSPTWSTDDPPWPPPAPPRHGGELPARPLLIMTAVVVAVLLVVLAVYVFLPAEASG